MRRRLRHTDTLGLFQVEGKENGTYLLLSKFEEDVVFEYHITIQDENFNLGILTMKTPEGVFKADFDAE